MPAVRARLRRTRPFGVGLRLSARGRARAGRSPRRCASSRTSWRASGLYVFTINGFPYGTFHGKRVKEEVYLPDWRDAKRARVHQSARRSAGASCCRAKPARWAASAPCPARSRRTRATPAGGASASSTRCCGTLRTWCSCERAPASTSRWRSSPSPRCFLETIEESVAFFRDHLFADAAVRRLSQLTGLDAAASRAGAARSSRRLPRPVPCGGRVRGSAGVRCSALAASRHRRAQDAGHRGTAAPRAVAGCARRRCASSTIPSTCIRWSSAGPQGLRRYVDLPDALRSADGRSLARRWSGACTCHVPIFLDDLGAFSSTQPFVREVLGSTSAASRSPRTSKSRPTPGACCPRRLARPASTRPSRASSPGCANSWNGADSGEVGCGLGRRQARPRLQPAHGVDQHAGGRDARRRVADAIRACRCCWWRCRCSTSAACTSTTPSTASSTRALGRSGRFRRAQVQRGDGVRRRLRHARGRRGAAGARRVRLPRRHRLAAAGIAGRRSPRRSSFYDAYHKDNPLSPVLMGLCRVLVYVSAATAIVAAARCDLLLAALVLLSYLIGLTYIAKHEHLERARQPVAAGGARGAGGLRRDSWPVKAPLRLAVPAAVRRLDPVRAVAAAAPRARRRAARRGEPDRRHLPARRGDPVRCRRARTRRRRSRGFRAHACAAESGVGDLSSSFAACLATNQGVVGSNPAGRASQSKACRDASLFLFRRCYAGAMPLMHFRGSCGGRPTRTGTASCARCRTSAPV